MPGCIQRCTIRTRYCHILLSTFRHRGLSKTSQAAQQSFARKVLLATAAAFYPSTTFPAQMTSLTITGVSMCLCCIFHPYRQQLWNWSEAFFAQRVGKAERQYTLLITTDFVYIVSITFENPNRFRCKIYSWGKGTRSPS